jgi:poly-gamma-glutamate capsule biosynthesis protein CapA/YwtB (metallophosphatase superfamily)
MVRRGLQRGVLPVCALFTTLFRYAKKPHIYCHQNRPRSIDFLLRGEMLNSAGVPPALSPEDLNHKMTARHMAKKVHAIAALGLLLLSVGLRAANATPQNAPAAASYPQEISRVTFAAAGDVIPHQAVTQAAAAAARTEAEANHGGWDALFADVADVFRQADFGFVNLETPVAPKHSLGSKPFQFDAPVALLEALKANGVKIVSFANNHVLDQGFAGFNETLGHLRDEGLVFVGSGDTAEDAWKPVILEKNGIKVGWLGMTRWLNGHRNPEKAGEPHVAFVPYPGEADGAPGLDEAGVLAAIKSARTQCDLLVVSIHWGVEYAPAPRPEDVEFAHKMLEAGAEIVIGHHPHVLQPIETYLTQDHRKTVVFFSLGNFLSNQSATYTEGLMPDKTGEPRDSIVVRFAAVKKDYGPAGIHVQLGDVGILPAWGENNRLQLKSGLAKIPSIHPVFMDREIARLQARLAQLNAPDVQMSDEQKQEFIQITNQLALLKHRRDLLLARTGDEFVVAPPNP